MRRAVILATLLLTVAGITVTQESYQTEPTALEATTRESTEVADEEPAGESGGQTRGRA
jgi:hypothetical protein